MADTFDAYYTWLGIPPEEQPSSLYRLLGVRAFENNAEVISNAADQRMSHLRGFQNGAHAAQSQKLLNEVSNARVTLLNADQKRAYDQKLRSEQERSRLPAAGPRAAAPPAAVRLPPMVEHPAAAPGTYAAPVLRPVAAKPAVVAAQPVASSPVAPVTGNSSVSVAIPGNLAVLLARKKTLIAAAAAVVVCISALVVVGGLLAFGFFKSREVAQVPAPPVVSPAPTTTPDTNPPTDDNERPVPTPATPAKPNDPSPLAEVVIRTEPNGGGTANAATGDFRPAYVVELGESGRLVATGAKEGLIPSQGDFTIEVWVKPGPGGGKRRLLETDRLDIVSEFQAADGAERWRHIAVCRAQGRLLQFMDGKLRTAAPVKDSDLGSSSIRVGGPGKGSAGQFAGQLRGLRTSNYARYVENFTPPENFARDARTTVLLDLSSNYRGTLVDACGRAELQLSGEARVADWNGIALAQPQLALAKPAPIQPVGAVPKVDVPLPVETSVDTPPAPTPVATTVSIPSEVEQQAAREKIRSAFGAALAKAAKPAEKIELARKFLEIVRDETNPAGRYVLLVEARELALGANDFNLGLEIHAKATEYFRIDEMAARLKLATDFAARPLSPEQRSKLVDEVLSVASSALQREQLNLADTASALAVGVANRGNDNEKKKQAKAVRDEWTTFKNVAGARLAAEEKLRTNPSDPSANLVVGRYHALLRLRWEQGLPHLAQGSDAVLAKAAQADLACQANAEAGPRMLAADAWHSAAASLKGEEKVAAQRRAIAHYEAVMAATTGIEKAKAENRVGELNAAVQAADAALAASNRKPVAEELLPGAILRLYVGSTGRETPTPFLAPVADRSDISNLNVDNYTSKAYGTYSCRYMLSGRIKLERDDTVTVSLDYAKCQVGGTALAPTSNFSSSIRQTLTLKKGEYPVAIASSDTYRPYFSFTDSNGQSVLFYSTSDLKREMAKPVSLPKGGTSAGILMQAQN